MIYTTLVSCHVKVHPLLHGLVQNWTLDSWTDMDDDNFQSNMGLVAQDKLVLLAMWSSGVIYDPCDQVNNL